jgi:ribosomal protein S18 acetylase RimI-like enzyme
MASEGFADPGVTGLEDVVVRNLRPADLDRVVKIDEQITGRSRRAYFEKKVEEALALSGIRISLGAEVDDHLVGFLLARLYYGEFGLPEPTAIIDTVGVDLGYRGRNVGTALFAQLETNLGALGIEKIQTHVDWEYQGLIGFLAAKGFAPAPFLTLERRL